MLTAATLGMFGYGSYSVVWAVVNLVRGAQLELWAELGLIVFGLLLVLSAALVRVGIPGGLAALSTSRSPTIRPSSAHNSSCAPRTRSTTAQTTE